MRSVSEYWYTTKEKLPKETDLCIGIRKNKYQFQISYKSGEWFDLNGKKIAEPDIWCHIQEPNEILSKQKVPRYFNDYAEVEGLLNGKTYKDVRDILLPHDDSFRYGGLKVDSQIFDNLICSVKVEHHDGLGDYAAVNFDLCGKTFEQLMKVTIIPMVG